MPEYQWFFYCKELNPSALNTRVITFYLRHTITLMYFECFDFIVLFMNKLPDVA